MRQLTRQGIGGDKRKASPISCELEESMWTNGLLKDDHPKKLLDTVLYLLGIHFALRSRDEHRSLRYGTNSQLTLGKENGIEVLKYREDCSKTRHGGIKDRFHEPKEGVVYSDGVVESSKDLVILYKKYISHRPPNSKTDAFYLRPLPTPRENVWYADVPMGVNTISRVVKTLTNNLDGANFFMNHSLRRTAVSRLNQSGFRIDDVKKRTGHHSNNGVMAYDVLNKHQIAAQSAALYGLHPNRKFENFEDQKFKTHEPSPSKLELRKQSLVKGALDGAHFENCTVNINFNC